ncbi:MAG TPA: hypothetical protein VMF29_00050, partial [Candidatus Edwardsbacteria bacterium]|nr:hypothetical protein [Candidatus Edwardsbacteria bacterium]
MAKRVEVKPDWLKAPDVVDIYSVSRHVTDDFADYINYWKHNGYWFFNSPDIIIEIAKQNGIHLEGTIFFYYEVHDKQWNEIKKTWESFNPEPSFETNVIKPQKTTKLAGYDVVTFS